MSGVQPANANAPIPSVFESRKCKILADLSVPDAEYTDLSPKGSVDLAIRDLIREVNVVPGLVTTSSCAGRISVFLEGRKKLKQAQQQQQQLQTQEEGGQSRQFAPSGGKGAGRWLFVSHDPLLEGGPEGRWRGEAGSFSSLHELFGMVKGDGRPPRVGGDGSGKGGRALRLVRFHYDPMVCFLSFPFWNSLNCAILTIQTDPSHNDSYAQPRQSRLIGCFERRIPRKRAAESSLSRGRGRS